MCVLELISGIRAFEGIMIATALGFCNLLRRPIWAEAVTKAWHSVRLPPSPTGGVMQTATARCASWRSHRMSAAGEDSAGTTMEHFYDTIAYCACLRL